MVSFRVSFRVSSGFHLGFLLWSRMRFLSGFIQNLFRVSFKVSLGFQFRVSAKVSVHLYKLSLGFHSRVSYQEFFSRFRNVQVGFSQGFFGVSFRVSIFLRRHVSKNIYASKNIQHVSKKCMNKFQHTSKNICIKKTRCHCVRPDAFRAPNLDQKKSASKKYHSSSCSCSRGSSSSSSSNVST